MLSVVALLASLSAPAAQPDYLRSALAGFSPGVPSGWACTIATSRNNERLLERFDPSLPVESQWTLLEMNQRPPTTAEVKKYQKSRPPGVAVGPEANFTRQDIELGSLLLVRENDFKAVFRGVFREESTGADKMLGHLSIELTVNKRHAYIEKYMQMLTAPYSPVLGVKMNVLQIETTFTEPVSEQPSLPARYSSRFTGSILLIPTEENLTVVFSGFSRNPDKLSR